MQKQIWTDTTQVLKATITNNRISEMSRRAYDTKVVRVFKDGLVGSASAVGPSLDESQLTARATAGLAFGITHPGPTAGDHFGEAKALRQIDPLDFQVKAQGTLDRLAKRYPGFLFSNSITCHQSTSTLQGPGGTLAHTQDLWSSVLLVRQVGSPKMLDSLGYVLGDDLDEQTLFQQLDDTLAPFATDVGPAPTGEVTVVFNGLSGIDMAFSRGLKAKDILQGTSMFQQGHDGFHPAFRLFDSRSPDVFARPFDMEGTVRDQLDLALIESGVLRGGVACLRDAALHKIKPTGNAEASRGYDLPTSTVGHLQVGATHEDLPELLPKEGAIEVYLSAGGDCSQKGDYGVPVMVGFHLDQHGKRVSRLPPAMLSGNLFQMFGDDFIGATRTELHPGTKWNGVVTKMVAG